MNLLVVMNLVAAYLIDALCTTFLVEHCTRITIYFNRGVICQEDDQCVVDH